MCSAQARISADRAPQWRGVESQLRPLLMVCLLVVPLSFASPTLAQTISGLAVTSPIDEGTFAVLTGTLTGTPPLTVTVT